MTTPSSSSSKEPSEQTKIKRIIVLGLLYGAACGLLVAPIISHVVYKYHPDTVERTMYAKYCRYNGGWYLDHYLYNVSLGEVCCQYDGYAVCQNRSEVQYYGN